MLARINTHASGMVLSNPVAEPDQFIAQIVREFGRLQGELSELDRKLLTERDQREQAVRDLDATTKVEMDGLVARVRDLDLSGLRWQLVGVFFVMVGVVGDLLF